MARKAHIQRIAVTPDIRAAFVDVEVKGQGGFQSLFRSLQTRIERQAVLTVEPDEFRRIASYATTYGEGGYQRRLRILLAHWTAQHLSEVMHV